MDEFSTVAALLQTAAENVYGRGQSADDLAFTWLTRVTTADKANQLLNALEEAGPNA